MKSKKVKVKKSAQEIQDEIFRKMPADKKIHLASKLVMLCFKPNRFNESNRTRITSNKRSAHSSKS